MSTPCRFFSKFTTLTWPAWKQKHQGHVLVKTVINQLPYYIYAIHCIDCQATYITNRNELLPANGIPRKKRPHV